MFFKSKAFTQGLLKGVGLLALIPSGALAQEQDADEGAELASEEASEDSQIIVTARKTEESLQEVPLAITVLDRTLLERSSSFSLDDIANLTPGLTFQNLGSGRNQIPTIRGLAQTNLFAAENNVGMFLNGVYLSNKSGIDIQLLDLERVEVVKGPQSALFGQSSFAGAINYVTAKPSDEFGARVVGTVGSDDWVDTRLMVEGPLADGLSARVNIAQRSFDGTWANRSDPSNNVQGFENFAISGQISADLGPSTTADLFVYYGDESREQGAEVLLANNCGGPPGFFTYFCGDLPAFREVDLTPGAFGLQRETYFGALSLNHQITDELSITSVTSYNDTETSSLTDFDFTGQGVPLGLLSGGTLQTNTWNSEGDLSSQEFSQELRLDWQGDRLRLLVGGFYFRGEEQTRTVAAVDSTNLPAGDNFASFFARLVSTPDPFNAPVEIVNRTTTTDSYAIFGLVSYDVTDQLTVSGEVRYNIDEKSIVRPNSLGRPAPSDEGTFKVLTPRFTVDYQATSDILVYASVAKGARAGGFNGLFSPLFPDESTFDEEVNWTYELGVKTQFLDGRGLLNAAVFHTDWTDLQIQSQSQDPTSIAQPVRNIAGARSTGFEIEAQYSPTDLVNLRFGYAYADPRFKDGSIDLGVASSCGGNTAICTFDANGSPLVEGNQLGRSHQHQLNGSVELGTQVSSDWSVFWRTDLSYLSEQPSRSINVQFVPERFLANMRFGFVSDRYEISLWARNLFDEAFATSQNRQPRFHTGTTTNTIQGDGRIVGLTGSMRF
jgi:iron complex outermembrane receptor protein